MFSGTPSTSDARLYPEPTKRGRGEPVKITGARRFGRGPGPDNLHMFLPFSVLSLYVALKVTLSDQTQVTLQLIVSLSDLV